MKCLTLPVGQSLGLLVVFCCYCQCVEHDENDDPPVEQLGLHVHSAFPSQPPIPLTSQLTANSRSTKSQATSTFPPYSNDDIMLDYPLPWIIKAIQTPCSILFLRFPTRTLLVHLILEFYIQTALENGERAK